MSSSSTVPSFTVEDVRAQLAKLGYTDVPQPVIDKFMLRLKQQQLQQSQEQNNSSTVQEHQPNNSIHTASLSDYASSTTSTTAPPILPPLALTSLNYPNYAPGLPQVQTYYQDKVNINVAMPKPIPQPTLPDSIASLPAHLQQQPQQPQQPATYTPSPLATQSVDYNQMNHPPMQPQQSAFSHPKILRERQPRRPVVVFSPEQEEDEEEEQDHEDNQSHNDSSDTLSMNHMNKYEDAAQSFHKYSSFPASSVTSSSSFSPSQAAQVSPQQLVNQSMSSLNDSVVEYEVNADIIEKLDQFALKIKSNGMNSHSNTSSKISNHTSTPSNHHHPVSNSHSTATTTTTNNLKQKSLSKSVVEYDNMEDKENRHENMPPPSTSFASIKKLNLKSNTTSRLNNPLYNNEDYDTHPSNSSLSSARSTRSSTSLSHSNSVPAFGSSTPRVSAISNFPTVCGILTTSVMKKNPHEQAAETTARPTSANSMNTSRKVQPDYEKSVRKFKESNPRYGVGGFRKSDPVKLFHSFSQDWNNSKFLNKKK